MMFYIGKPRNVNVSSMSIVITNIIWYHSTAATWMKWLTLKQVNSPQWTVCWQHLLTSSSLLTSFSLSVLCPFWRWALSSSSLCSCCVWDSPYHCHPHQRGSSSPPAGHHSLSPASSSSFPRAARVSSVRPSKRSKRKTGSPDRRTKRRRS